MLPGIEKVSSIIKSKERRKCFKKHLMNSIKALAEKAISVKPNETLEEKRDRFFWSFMHLAEEAQNFQLEFNGDRLEFFAYFFPILMTWATLNQDLRDLESILDTQENIEKAQRKFVKKIQKEAMKHGWLIAMSEFTIDEVPSINKYAKSDPQAFSEFLCSRLRKEETLDKIKKKWGKNKYFQRRIRFLERGRQAHKEGDYICSVSVLLPHLEGILEDYARDTGFELPEKFQGPLAVGVLKKIVFKELAHDIDKNALKDSLRKIYETLLESNVPVLNRNIISHGKSLDYDCEEVSAQLIYLLNSICDLTQAEIKEIKGKP
jgi:hypothetical protein